MSKEKGRLNGLKRKFDDAEKYGLNLQKEGIKIVSYAENGKEVINFIENNKGLINKPYIKDWINGSGDIIPTHPPDNLGEIDRYSMRLGVSSATASAYFFSQGSDLLSLSKKPTIDFLQNYDEEMAELDSYLRSFTDIYKDIGDLSAMRKSAWDVFNSVIETNLAMASHSMREILSKVIAKLADNKKVMGADWWEPSGDKETPTLRQRLRYLLFGSKEENKSLEMVSNAVEKSFDADDKLKKVAHGSRELREEIKKAMRTTEYALLVIFRARSLK